jgi:hypothetical protein
MAKNEGEEEWTRETYLVVKARRARREQRKAFKIWRGEEAEESRPWEDETSPEENSPKDRKTKISNKARRQTSSTIETTTLDHICRRRN